MNTPGDYPQDEEELEIMTEAKANIGFTYQKPEINLHDISAPNLERTLFRAKKAFEQVIFDTVKLEGSPYTFPEVKTLLDGITVGGHKLSDQEQVLNQARSWKRLFDMVKNQSFRVDKETFRELHAIAGKDEALTWGIFRDGEVSIAGTEHKPPAAAHLDATFDKGCEHINSIDNPIERGMAFFLFGSLNQFLYDVNKRVSRLIMNGILLSAGYDVINIPAKRQLEFNQKMIRFYDTKNGAEMMEFLASCSLDTKLAETSFYNHLNY